MRFSSFLLSAAVAALATAECNHDNCLRQILGTPAASTFCMTYTQSVQTASTGLPSYVSMCSSSASRISSACSCAVTTTFSTTATPTTSMVCNHDNCLRQILGTPAATTFCDAYTHGTSTATAGLPTYVSMCSASPSRISSACSCAATPSPTSCSTPNTLCGNSLTGYCADFQTDANNCGSCGNVCSASEDCCSGVCTDVETDPNNCGSCGSGCTVGDTCSDGICSTGSCVGPPKLRRAFIDYCPGQTYCGIKPLSRFMARHVYPRFQAAPVPLSVKRKRALMEREL